MCFLLVTRSRMAGPGAMWVLSGFLVSGLDVFLCVTGECLWYLGTNGSRYPGFDCPLSSFCCGDCHSRYCCRDRNKFISEGQQKKCLPIISRGLAAGLSSFLTIFILMIVILMCCSCCYFYRRRSQMEDVQMVVIPVQAYPRQPVYIVDNRAQTGYPPSGQPYQVYSPGPANYSQAAPPPYVPPRQ